MSNVEQWEHNEQRAMETEITTLREQVEKLTKERDFWRDGCQKEKLSAIDWAGKHQAQLLDHETQLAALAEQNAKLREVLVDCEQALDECRDYPITYDSVIEALSLPNLASPALNRIRAEGMRVAEE